MFALPGMQDRHTGYRASGLQRNGIDGIVSADDERNVGVREVVVDLVHFQHDCRCALARMGLEDR